MKNLVRFGVLLVIFGMLGGCLRRVPPFVPPTAPYWSTAGWISSTPEQQGMDSGKIAEALDYVHKEGFDLDSLLIVRHGFLILDAYFYPYSSETLHDVASVTKSITSSLIGMALNQGSIKSIDQAALDFFPERPVKSLDENKRRITIRDLLTMSSGLNCGLRGEPELFAMLRSSDWVQFTLDLPMRVSPGTEFAYCSPGMHLLGAIVEKASGISTRQMAETNLFKALGIKDFVWPVDPQSLVHGWGDLRLHPHDMAKIGYLYLQGGQWDGRQILSPAWVADATGKQVAVPGGDADYGYGWWVLREFPGLYEARGRGGQFISVWPQKDLIMVWTGSGPDRRKLASLLLVALKDRPLPENPEALSRLQGKVKDAQRPSPPGSVSPPPAIAGKIAHKDYWLNDNSFQIERVSLTFPEEKEATLTLVMSGRSFQLSVGLDDTYRTSATGPSGFPSAAKGEWKTDHEFIIRLKDLGGPNRFMLSLTFKLGQVTVRLEDLTGLFPTETFDGKIRE
jgi:CubicO group peptidase (beta-lactamase class C family)